MLTTHDAGIPRAVATLAALNDERMMAPWHFVDGEEILMTIPRMGVVRTILLNHLYHHRGQLGVYLRLLGAKVPSAYGPSGDEMPPQFESTRATQMAGAGKGR